jgi:hypothetical protein
MFAATRLSLSRCTEASFIANPTSSTSGFQSTTCDFSSATPWYEE